MKANEMRQRFLLFFEGSRLANRTFNDREISDFLTKAELEYVQVRVDKLKNKTQRGIGDGFVRASELAGLISANKTYVNIPTTATGKGDFIIGDEENGALKRPELDSQVAADQYGIFAPIPDEAMYVVSEFVDMTDSNDPKNQCRNIKVKDITYEYYANGIYDPYAWPSYDFVWGLDWGSFTPSTFDPATGLTTESTKKYTIEGAGSSPGDNFNMSDTGSNTGATVNTTKISTDRSRHLIPGKGFTITKYIMHYIIQPKGVNVNVQVPTLQKNSIMPDHTHQAIVDIAVRLASGSLVPTEGKYQVNQIESQNDE